MEAYFQFSLDLFSILIMLHFIQANGENCRVENHFKEIAKYFLRVTFADPNHRETALELFPYDNRTIFQMSVLQLHSLRFTKHMHPIQRADRGKW